MEYTITELKITIVFYFIVGIHWGIAYIKYRLKNTDYNLSHHRKTMDLFVFAEDLCIAGTWVYFAFNLLRLIVWFWGLF